MDCGCDERHSVIERLLSILNMLEMNKNKKMYKM